MGRKRQRHTTVVFVLRNPSLVQFAVFQVSPDCRRYARFRVVGHEGVNRVQLGSRVGRRRLRPGTYRLVARAVPGGRQVVDARLVVVSRANRGEIEARRGADTCAPALAGPEARAQNAAATAGGRTSTGGPTGSKAPAATTRSKSARHEGVLGARFARKAAEAARRVPLWLYLLLVLAIILLAAAALPLRAASDGRTASALARHRGSLALAGAATLVLVMAAYLLL